MALPREGHQVGVLFTHYSLCPQQRHLDPDGLQVGLMAAEMPCLRPTCSTTKGMSGSRSCSGAGRAGQPSLVRCGGGYFLSPATPIPLFPFMGLVLLFSSQITLASPLKQLTQLHLTLAWVCSSHPALPRAGQVVPPRTGTFASPSPTRCAYLSVVFASYLPFFILA